MLFCDGCEAGTTQSRRGWRAYVVVGADGERGLEVLCPVCAEAVVGEDEAVWSE